MVPPRPGLVVCFLFFCLACLSHAATPPQTLWIRDLDDANLTAPFFVSPGPANSVFFASSHKATVGRLDAGGDLLFRKSLVANGAVDLLARATDSAGSLVLSARIGNPFLPHSPALFKISPAGDVLWTNSPIASFKAAMSTICTDAAGNIYAGGYFAGQLDFGVTNFATANIDQTAGFLVKYSPDGNFLWALMRLEPGYVGFRSLSVDAAGDLWASGINPAQNGDGDSFIEKFTSDGGSVFKKPHAQMDLLATGTLEPFMWKSFYRFYPSPPQQYSADPQLGRLQANGDIRWFKDGFTGLGFSRFFEPAQDAEFSTYFLGGHGAGASVNGLSFAEAGVSVIKFDSDGDSEWAKTARGLTEPVGHSIAVFGPDAVYFAGAFATHPDFNVARIDHFALARTNRSVFIAKLGPLAASSRPILSLPPRDLELIEGHTGYIIAGAASVSAPTFQWFHNDLPIPETNTFITLAPVNRSHAGLYKIRVTNANGEVTSAPVRLTVRIPPTITEQPVAPTASAGETATLAISAAGEEPLAYQWQFQGEPIAGATNSTLSLTNITYFDQGDYRIAVTNLYGSAVSAPATVTVLSPPILGPITYFERPIIAGSNLTLSAGITGSEPIQYQWYEKGIAILGATSNALHLPRNYSAGPFSVIAWNQFGRVTNDSLWPLRLMYPLSVVATNQTNNFRYTALAAAGAHGFFALRSPPPETPTAPSYLQRFDASLRPVWAAPLATEVSSTFARDLASDAETNLFVVGDFRNEVRIGSLTAQSTGAPKFFLARISPAGQPISITPFGLEYTNRLGRIRFFDGSVWVVGETLITKQLLANRPSVATINLTLAQFDTAGGLVWSNLIATFPKPDAWTNPPIGLSFGNFTVDANTNFYIGGTLSEFAGTREAQTLLKYDRSGALVWAAYFASTNRIETRGGVTAVEIAPDNDIFVTGYFAGHGVSAFLARLDPNGQQRWIRRFTPYFGSTGDGPLFRTLDLLPNGNVLVGGQAWNDFWIATDRYATGGFALEFSPDGNLIAPTSFGPTGTFVLDILLLGDRVIAAGYFRLFQGQVMRGQLHSLGGLAPKFTSVDGDMIFHKNIPVSLRPQVTGSGPVAFQWLRNGELLPGETNAFLNLDTTTAALAGLYQLIVRNALGAATNPPISISSYRFDVANNKPTFTISLPPQKTFRLEYRDTFDPATAWMPWRQLTGVQNSIVIDDVERMHRFYRLVPE